MKLKFGYIAGAAALAALAGCVDEMGAAMEDPGAFACRERAVSLMRVDFDMTSATPINFDAFGYRNYSVNAGGVNFRCSVNDEGNIVAFSRM
ncbi:hypothetical protein RGUI_1402 [Rhodovulum sp. P5]|nr:hypothetical protein RGUI_1402 [Rhodovulum sp. P5]